MVERCLEVVLKLRVVESALPTNYYIIVIFQISGILNIELCKSLTG